MIDLSKYTRRQRIALERLNTKTQPEPMCSNDPLTRETKVIHNRFRCITGVQVHDDAPMVWNFWFGIVDTKDALIGHDDYFVPIEMHRHIDGAKDLCAMWLEDISQLPRNVEKTYEATHPKGRPVSFHLFIKLDDDERRYVEDIVAQRVIPTVITKDPGWNALPGELDEKP